MYDTIVWILSHLCSFFFFFNDTATTEIYTLSLHDALPILHSKRSQTPLHAAARYGRLAVVKLLPLRQLPARHRSEEHTSELQSLAYLVCRLLLEKKKQHLPQTQLESTHAFVRVNDATRFSS